MGAVDPYALTDKLDDSLLQVIVTRLEARGKHPLFAKMLQDYLEAMRIDTAKTVLDMGCGTGVAARGIAQRRAFSGRVLGIDLSASLAATATRLATEEGSTPGLGSLLLAHGRSRPVYRDDQAVERREGGAARASPTCNSNAGADDTHRDRRSPKPWRLSAA